MAQYVIKLIGGCFARDGLPHNLIGPFETSLAAHDWYQAHGDELSDAGVETAEVSVIWQGD